MSIARPFAVFAVVAVLSLTELWLATGNAQSPLPTGTPPAVANVMADTPAAPATYARATFADIIGWASDDHAAALETFRLSCAKTSPDAGLARACTAAKTIAASSDAARLFFEENFVPHRVENAGGTGLLTAYYEPILQGRRARSPGFEVPLHRRPHDLVNLVDEADRASSPTTMTHARKTSAGHVPFPSREQIDQGALTGQGLELFYVADEVERFFLQVQGSGVIELADGSHVRVTYDGKNGYPYTSVGRVLIDAGAIPAEGMSLQALAAWLRSDPERGRRAIWHNKSYVFFREMPAASAPVGVLGVPLTARRSLAVDPAYHALGLPIFVDAPDIVHITGKPFRHLMIGQDVGSAIKGAVRGDIYAGSGPEAGAVAGITKHPGRFFVLLPRTGGLSTGTVSPAPVRRP